MVRVLLVLIATLLGALTVAPSAHAQAAQRHLEAQHREVNRILRQPARSEAARRRRSQRLTEILNGLLDYRTLSESSLGEHWSAQNPAARTRFVELLQQLVERNYETNLERILDYEVSYDSETRRGAHTIVTTSARSRTQRRQPPVEIEYTLHRVEGRWRVIDVRTDGVSMVENYRGQFARIISREGWTELIARMERRLEDSNG